METTTAPTETLTAKRHWLAKDCIVVTTDAREWAAGNVVARFHEPTATLRRTKHEGAKPALSVIRAAIATVPAREESR